jgi:hypothetical protein
MHLELPPVSFNAIARGRSSRSVVSVYRHLLDYGLDCCLLYMLLFVQVDLCAPTGSSPFPLALLLMKVDD